MTTQCINDCMTDIHDHWYSLYAWMLMNHNVWCTLFLLFSKPQLPNRARVEHRYQPRPFTKTDRDHHLYASCCQAVRTLLYAENLYAIHCQFCHTALLRNIFCGQDPSEFMRLYTVSPSDVGPGKFGSQALEKAFWAKFFPHFPTLLLKVKMPNYANKTCTVYCACMLPILSKTTPPPWHLLAYTQQNL